MKQLSKEDQKRIRKAALDMLCDGDTIPTFFEGAQYEHPIARKEGFNEALEEVKKLIEETRDMSMSQIIYFVEEIEKLKR